MNTKWFRSEQKGQDRQFTIRVEIKKSSIPGAGYGVFALDPIPEGLYTEYNGRRVRSQDASQIYSWRLVRENRGIPVLDPTQWYIDGSENIPENWPRFVNCGMTPEANNLLSAQRDYRIFYHAKRLIKSGEELFVDYGPEYRKSLGIDYSSSKL